MPFYRKRFVRRPRRKIVRRYKRKGLGKRHGGIKKLIKRMISRKFEKKVINYTTFASINIAGQTNAATLQANTFNLLPSISQGAGDGQRIGDRIDVKSAVMKGYVCMNNSQSPLQPFFLRTVVFSIKDYNADITGATIPSIEVSNFFRSGGSTGSAVGTTADIFSPLNKQRLNVYSDKVVFMSNNVTPATGTTGTYVNSGPQGKSFHYINIHFGKHIKRMIYDENGTNPNLPTNHNMWVAFLYAPLDDTTNSTTNFLHLNAQGYMTYQDA